MGISDEIDDATIAIDETKISEIEGRAKSKIKIPQNYRGRPSFTLVSFLVNEDKRFNAG